MANEYLPVILQFQQKHSVRSGRFTDSIFHYTVLLPADMIYHKVGKDFFWVPNNMAQGMQDLCVYTSSEVDNQPPERMDSVPRTDIKGKTDRTYMRTMVRPVTQENVRIGRQLCQLQRGLWEMMGSVMGGPLVRCIVRDSIADKSLVLDASVYALKMGKCNKMCEMEAVLPTVKRR